MILLFNPVAFTFFVYGLPGYITLNQGHCYLLKFYDK